jgi:hypothetical protein
MVAAFVPEVADIVTNFPAPNAKPAQLDDEGNVRAVHVMPSGEVAAPPAALATAKKELLPYHILFHTAVVGSVLEVQSRPLVEDAAMVPEVPETITNRPFP